MIRGLRFFQDQSLAPSCSVFVCSGVPDSRGSVCPRGRVGVWMVSSPGRRTTKEQ